MFNHRRVFKGFRLNSFKKFWIIFKVGIFQAEMRIFRETKNYVVDEIMRQQENKWAIRFREFGPILKEVANDLSQELMRSVESSYYR